MRTAPVSLLWKILISTSLAITGLFAALGWVVQDQFVRIASSTLEDEVRTSFHAYDSLWKARADQLASVSLVLSRMPDVRAAFGTGDRATIRDVAGEIWDKIARPGTLFLVTDPQGNVLADLGARSGARIRRMPVVVEAGRRFPQQATGFIVQDDKLLQIVVTPVYVAAGGGSALLNVLVAGIAVDGTLARELKQATGGSDFVFASGGRVVASSLDLRAKVEAGEHARFTTPLLDVGGQHVGELRILRSFEAAQQRISALRTNIVLLWAAAVLAGLGMTYLAARRLLRPVAELDRAAAEIGRGNYDVVVPVREEDELGRLARTFNSMCASIRGAREKLIDRERISTIGRLSTSIVHDLRNPLASIYGGAEMLVDSALSEGQVKRLAANIYRASRRMQELLQELSDVTRGKAHARELCSLREVVEAAYATVGQQAAERKVRFEIAIPDLELPLDRSPMERVFQNLFGNAIEAMPEGGVVRVWARQEGESVLAGVEDDGPGVPHAIAPNLFRPFVTHGKKNGMGLGLALSRETAVEHGGDLWLDRNAARGARFLLRLPAATGGVPAGGVGASDTREA